MQGMNSMRNSLLSNRSKQSYREAVNKMQNKKSMLEQYYSGPPKFSFESTANDQEIKKRLAKLNSFAGVNPERKDSASKIDLTT